MAAPERSSHSGSLFITDLGPMRFYVRPGPLKRQLSPLITDGGGIVCRVQEPGAFLLAEPGEVYGIQYLSSAYITDCVRLNRRLSPRTYRLLNRGTAGAGQSCITGGIPDGRHRVERKHPTPEKITGAGREGASVSCDQTPNAGGQREGEGHAALESHPEGNGLDPCSNGPSAMAAASCDLRVSDPCPSAQALAQCDPNVSPASCDPHPSPEAPAPLDSGPASRSDALDNHKPPAPVLCDAIPEIVGPVMKGDTGTDAGQMEEPTISDTREDNAVGHSAVEEDQAKSGKESDHQAGPSSPVHTVPGPVGRLPFSRQEDIAILLYVKENASPKRSVTGTLLWKELEKKQLLRRTWQAMKCRYTKYIVRHKHRYRLPLAGLDQGTKETVPVETPMDINNQPRGPSSAATTIDLISQHHDLLPAETSIKNPCPQEPPHAAGSKGEDTEEGACTDQATDNDECGSHTGGSEVIRRVRTAKRRIVTEVIPKPVQEIADSSSEAEEGMSLLDSAQEGGPCRGQSRSFFIENGESMATSKQMPILQENRGTDDSEDLQIFEIANMEFEVEDEDSRCKVKFPGISLKDFVMGEDSVSADTQTQVDDISSPDLSDSEDLQVALSDMMREFNLDICQVTQALLKNNGEVGSTRHFLRFGRRPDGLPIWEHKDDIELQRNDPILQAQLSRKYGADNVAKRVAFLAS